MTKITKAPDAQLKPDELKTAQVEQKPVKPKIKGDDDSDDMFEDDPETSVATTNSKATRGDVVGKLLNKI